MGVGGGGWGLGRWGGGWEVGRVGGGGGWLVGGGVGRGVCSKNKLEEVQLQGADPLLPSL